MKNKKYFIFKLELIFSLIFFVVTVFNAFADPYPWADQKLPPLVLQKHGMVWAGGGAVKRTQPGSLALFGSRLQMVEKAGLTFSFDRVFLFTLLTQRVLGALVLMLINSTG